MARHLQVHHAILHEPPLAARGHDPIHAILERSRFQPDGIEPLCAFPTTVAHASFRFTDRVKPPEMDGAPEGPLTSVKPDGAAHASVISGQALLVIPALYRS